MDATRALLQQVAERFGRRVVLWRGPRLDGADVDMLALPGAAADLAAWLWAAGLRPQAGDPGHVVWSSPTGAVKPIDVLDAAAWPASYPSLAGLVDRLVATEVGPPSASDADRALIAAAEAVAGRPLGKVVLRTRELVAEPQAHRRLEAVAEAERLRELGRLIADPDRLLGLGRRGRLPYGQAARVALRCRAARAALLQRARRRAARALPQQVGRALRQPAARPLLITVSGMDGAGKSTACGALQAELERRGRPTEVVWARLGGESRMLDRLGGPVKRLLRRPGTIADPVAAGGPDVAKTRDPREAAGRRRPVSWAWIVVVAVVNARSYRQAAGRRSRSVDVVCDRWATDALVDLRLRYGPHPVAERLLRCLAPRRDLGILLHVDAATARRRKPGDQAPHILEAMERGYAERAQRERLLVIDGRLPLPEVERRLSAAVAQLHRRSS